MLYALRDLEPEELYEMRWKFGVSETAQATEFRQRRSEGFGARDADFRLAPPPPRPSPQKKFVINQNLQNRLNCWQNLAILKQIKFLVGRFSLVGEPSGPKISIFLEDLICFLLMWGRQNVN